MSRLRTLLAVGVGSCTFAAVGYGAALTMAPADGGGGPPVPTEPVTAEVELRQLTSQVVVRGDAGFADPVRVGIATTAPVPVVTRTPVRAGDSLKAGDVLVEVAGRPVLALPGDLPPYRDLVPGDTGPDVLQLERALEGLGLDPGDVDDSFTSSTSGAVRDLYERLDYEAPTLADLGLSAPADGGGDGGGDVGAGAGPGAGPGAGEDQDAGPALEDVVVLPRGEVTFVPSLPRRVDRMPAKVGALLPDQPIQLSGSELVVTVDLTAADTDVLEAGMRALVDLPGGKPVRGRLGEVKTTTSGGRTTVRLPDLSPARQRQVRSANVKVTVPLQSSQGEVLVVPLAALSTDASGTVRVERVDRDGDTEMVEVQVGLSADGYVEILPTDALAKGDRVVVGS